MRKYEANENLIVPGLKLFPNLYILNTFISIW